jgi:hypothetical protein
MGLSVAVIYDLSVAWIAVGGSLADSEHIDVLRRGSRVWNAWREENPSQVPNLDDAALTLGERQLGPVNGGPINLRSAQMQRAFLRSATLSAADLEAADMSGADLAYARLDRANLKAANLSYAVLDYADFNDAILTDTNLSGASLRHVQNLAQAQINHSICDAATILVNAGVNLQRRAGAKVQHGRKQESPRYRGPSCLSRFFRLRRPAGLRWRARPWHGVSGAWSERA